jgi:hypothetical protein
MQYKPRVSGHGTGYSTADVRAAACSVNTTLLAVSSGYCLRHLISDVATNSILVRHSSRIQYHSSGYRLIASNYTPSSVGTLPSSLIRVSLSV